MARRVETWTLDCSQTTAIKVSKEGNPDAWGLEKLSLIGLRGGDGGKGMVVEQAITDVARSER